MARRRPTMNRVSALIVSLVLLLGGCGGTLPPETHLTVTVTAAGFSPTQLEVRRGDQVVITFQNRDQVGHTLTLELPTGRRAVAAEPKVDAILNFPANEPGSLRFFCAVPGHTEEGQLVIRP